MPQLAQLPDIFWSQLFWLAVVFGLIFFVVGRGMLPKVEATVDAREAKIAEDLAAADRARVQADEIEAAYRARMDASRAETLKVIQASKVGAAVDSESRVKAADVEIAAKTAAAEARIQEASAAAMKEIEGLAAELTEDLVARLTGMTVTRDQAFEAVRTAIHG